MGGYTLMIDPQLSAAGRATSRIIEELRGRSGFDGVWDSLDDELKEEVTSAIHVIIEQEYD